jgi:hypothetical protein
MRWNKKDVKHIMEQWKVSGLDNNQAENSIRLVAPCRKKYLFAGSHDAAQRAAPLYSLFATCKLHSVHPYDWLKYIWDSLINCKPSTQIELLSQQVKNRQKDTL